jgi:hypothetical protein
MEIVFGLELIQLQLKMVKIFIILTFDDISDSYNLSYLYEHIFNNMTTGVAIIRSENGEDFYVKDIKPICL